MEEINQTQEMENMEIEFDENQLEKPEKMSEAPPFLVQNILKVFADSSVTSYNFENKLSSLFQSVSNKVLFLIENDTSSLNDLEDKGGNNSSVNNVKNSAGGIKVSPYARINKIKRRNKELLYSTPISINNTFLTNKIQQHLDLKDKINHDNIDKAPKTSKLNIINNPLIRLLSEEKGLNLPTIKSEIEADFASKMKDNTKHKNNIVEDENKLFDIPPTVVFDYGGGEIYHFPQNEEIDYSINNQSVSDAEDVVDVSINSQSVSDAEAVVEDYF